MDTLILTLQLFTSLPIKKNVEVSDERLIRGVALWPAAGIVIGLFQALVFCLADGIFPLQIAAVLALMAELWMTRGFHLDGLCDTADAVFSSRSRERMLEIMKDSHIGTFGVVAAVMDLALKYLLVTASEVPVYMLLAAPVAGKMVQGWLLAHCGPVAVLFRRILHSRRPWSFRFCVEDWPGCSGNIW